MNEDRFVIISTDGFTGKYVIWENELQKYKNKNEMIDNE